jgi:ubiquitin-conjugating enzyme E2 D/E
VGIDCIQHNWTLALTFAKVLLSVQSLLTDPCTDAYMEASAANLYRDDREQFDKVARVWTWKYAMHDILVH